MLGGMGNILKQAQKMQKDMQLLQEELAKKEYEAAAGGDMVTVKVNGKMEVLSIKIAQEVVDPNDIGLLQDLCRSAVNAAIAKAREDSQSLMKNTLGGLNIPGLSL